MLKKKVLTPITEKELEYMECQSTPRCIIESYFHDFDSLGDFDEEKLGSLRTYQYPMISYEPFVDTKNRPNMTQVEKFNLRKTIGDCFNMGSRKYGKTLCTEKLDMMVTVLHSRGEQIGFTSISDEKIRTVLDDVSEGLESHPFYAIYKVRCRRNPYNIRMNNGCRVIGINMDVTKTKAGDQFLGKHYKRLYIEEASGEPIKVYEKRKDSISELGCVMRVAGMTNFTEHQPAGKQYYNPDNINKIINYPQFVNPIAWNETEKQEKLRDFGGEDSWGWKVFVEGEILTDGVSEVDMERVRPHYNQKRAVKCFTLRKDKFHSFQNVFVVERPPNADSIFISGDIGDGKGGTEIIIHAKIGDKFVYLYNITLYSLTEDEQYDIFKWLGVKLSANVIALDCGEGVGRGLFRRLEKVFPKECMVWYSGNEKVAVDYVKDDNGNVKYEKGKPVTQDEVMASWGFLYLRDLLYDGKIIMGLHYKLDNQLSKVISLQSVDGTRRRYLCGLEDDHLFDAHRVFAIAVWQKHGLKLGKVKQEWGISSMASNNSSDKKFKTDGKWGLGSISKNNLKNTSMKTEER